MFATISAKPLRPGQDASEKLLDRVMSLDGFMTHCWMSFCSGEVMRGQEMANSRGLQVMLGSHQEG